MEKEDFRKIVEQVERDRHRRDETLTNAIRSLLHNRDVLPNVEFTPEKITINITNLELQQWIKFELDHK